MISLFFITFSLIHFGQAGYSCTFDFAKDTATTNRPVYLKRTIKGRNFKGIEAEEPEVLYLAGKDKTIYLESYLPDVTYSNLLLVCPGDGNFVNNAIGQQTVEIACKSDGSFLYQGEEVTVKDLACAKPVTLRFKLRGLEGKNLCEEFEGSKAAHLVYEVQKLTSKFRIGRDFVMHRMVPEQEVISFPRIKTDKTDLKTLFVPMYASISVNNMAKVENFVRSKARENEDQFTEVLTVSIDSKGVKRQGLTENKKDDRVLLVPLIVAKIIKTKKFCLGLLVVNRLKRVSEAESICESECWKYSLTFNDKPSLGRVLCCPYSSISGYIPEDLKRTYLGHCNS